jgi:hypothetical protein
MSKDKNREYKTRDRKRTTHAKRNTLNRKQERAIKRYMPPVQQER